ncbi:MAG: hypothetical protein IJY46_06425, partial [Lentisphaeria bacterium]|nr:hypothetical protein [Lentisphaeria bacterium]
MHRAASSFALTAAEDRSKITRSFSPIQGILIKLNNYHSQGMSKAQAGGMPQSEVSGKSTVTAECEARAARRLSRRR